MQTDSHEIQTILRRIETLEKEYRRLRRTGLALAVVAVAVFGMAQTKPKPRTVEAEKLILNGPDGRQRATFVVHDDEPELLFFDEEGRVRAALGTRPDSSPVVRELLKKQGLEGQMGLYLFGANHQEYSEMRESGVMVWGEGQAAVASVGMLPEGRPSVLLRDNQGYEASLGATDVLIKGGTLSKREIYSTDTAEGLLIRNGYKKGEGLLEKRPAACLALFGKDKRLVWSAP
jgi:hypothetical protein